MLWTLPTPGLQHLWGSRELRVLPRASSLPSSAFPRDRALGAAGVWEPPAGVQARWGWGCPLGSLGEYRGSWCYRVRGTGPPAKSWEGLGSSQGQLLGFAHAGGLVPQGTGVRLLHARPTPKGRPIAPCPCHLPQQVSALECSLCWSPPSPGQPRIAQDTCPLDVPLPHCLLPLVSSLSASFASQPHPGTASAPSLPLSAAQCWVMAATKGEP